MTHIATTSIESNYIASEQNHYIGVDSKKPVVITLPERPLDGKVIIVKAEMRPPMANRHITIITNDGSTIDGYTNFFIQTSNESVQLVYHGSDWHVI